MRERPLRERKPQKKIEEDPQRRTITSSQFPVPAGSKEFKEGYRECIELFALHAPRKRTVGRVLDDHCVTLEEACLRSGMSRADLARYEGFRQAIKDLRRRGRIKA